MSSAQSPSRILVVEDDDPTRELVAIVLRRAGYEVDQAVDGESALGRFLADRPDLVMLDLGLPGEDGLQVLDRLHEISEVPVVVLSGQSDEVAKVRALMRGADDYLVKPASAPELLARVAAVLRRARRRPDEDARDVYDDGLLRVDMVGRTATIDGGSVALTPLEYRLLSAFVRNPGKILSRAQLLELAWGDSQGGPDEHVKLTVGYLRRKLGALDGEPIETVRGFGYRWTRGATEPGEPPQRLVNA